MIVRNHQQIPECHRDLHDGQGLCDNRELFRDVDFETNLAFLVRTIIPPGATIGYHSHGADEEMYVILSGHAIMTVNGERRDVGPGDAILNRQGWSHGLENLSDAPVEILVFLVRM